MEVSEGDATASMSALVKNENCVCKTTQACPCAGAKSEIVSTFDISKHICNLSFLHSLVYEETHLKLSKICKERLRDLLDN